MLDAAVHVARRLRQAGHDAFLVGGAVRDMLLGHTPKDVDVATSATPDAVMALFEKVIPTGIAHGTVTVLMRETPVEVTTFRTEGAYSDGRRPDRVKFVGRVEEDLARRDFTFNALAMDPNTGEIVDPHRGQEDLRAGIVRAVGDARARFSEDALRILRAVRFACRLGFQIESGTLQAAKECVERLQGLSWERIAGELLAILESPRPSWGAQLLQEIGALRMIAPEVARMVGFDQRNPHHADDLFTHTLKVLDGVPPRAALRLAALLHDVGKPDTCVVGEDGVAHYLGHPERGAELAEQICRRLKLSNAVRERVVLLVREHMIPYEAGPRVIRRLVGAHGWEAVEDLVALREADWASREGKPGGKLWRLLEVVRREQDRGVKLTLNGHDVMAHLGIPEGPQVGAVLRFLREKIEEDPECNTPEKLLELARGFCGRA